MAEARQQIKVVNQLVYEQGRRARLEEADVIDCPYLIDGDPRESKEVTKVRKTNRMDWTHGWYDQHYGMKWEPKTDNIKNRCWPVHL